MINENISLRELQKLILETQNDAPARTTLDILKYVNKHKSFAIKEFGKYVKYFEDYFDVLNEAIFNLNYLPKETWPQYKGLQYLLFPEALKTLHRAFEDTLDGYYDEALMLLRSIYETYVKLIFLVCYPKDCEAIFCRRKGKLNFNLTNFIEKELNLDWGILYRGMSTVYHSKTHRNLSRWIEVSQGKFKGEITLEYKYNRDEISRPMNISTFLLYALFNFMLVTFKDDFDKSSIPKDIILRMVKIDKALRGIIELFPNKFSLIVKDIDKINSIVKEVSQGRNWKMVK